MKKSALMITAAAVLAAGSFGTMAAMAHSNNSEGIQGSNEGIHRMAKKHKFGGRHIDALAELLGMSTEELRDARANGTNIRELLEQNGITKEDVHAAMREDFEEKLAQLVQEGELTQEEADAKLERMDNRHLAMHSAGRKHFRLHKQLN